MRNLLLTRPSSQSEAFAAGLSEKARANAHIVISPLIAIEGVAPPPEVPDFDKAIFTSTNGVKFGPDGRGRAAYCVGARTAEAAQQRGWHVVDRAEDAEALLVLLKGHAAGETWVHFAGQHRRVDIASALVAMGQTASTVVVYDQVLRSLSDEAQRLLSAEIPLLVPLFSPRTAKHFMHEAQDTSHAHILAMSRAVADEVDPARVAALQIVAAPTAEEMRGSIENLLSETSLS